MNPKNQASPTVGIIPNPASGKDIRRIVAHGFMVGNQDKVILVRRLLIGLHSAGVAAVQIMPDTFGIGRKAIEGLRNNNAEVASIASILNMELSGSMQDTIQATRVFCDNEVGCIIPLGGDGTTRLVGINCGEIPILPLSTGTNNVLPRFIDGTVAGLCAGYFVQQPRIERLKLCYRAKRLDIEVNQKIVDSALVDVAALVGDVIASRAVWEAENIRQIFVTQASPINIGLSAIAGMLCSVTSTDPFGVALELNFGDSGKSVYAVIAPGLISNLPYEALSYLEPSERYPITRIRPLVLALDGEREVVLNDGDVAAVFLNQNGPRIVNVELVMQKAVASGYFTRN